MLALLKAAARGFSLELRSGHRVVNVRLDASQVTTGADRRASNIVVANAPRPMSLRYWIKCGQPLALDYATARVTNMNMATGDEQRLGTATSTIESNTSDRRGLAMQHNETEAPASAAGIQKPSHAPVRVLASRSMMASTASPNAPSVERRLPPQPPPLTPPRKG